jgi:hypothetical protein
MKLPFLAIMVLSLFFSSVGFAGIKVKCGDCTRENPCATVFTFKDLKFHHSVFCWVDSDGNEHWDSTDYEKLQMYDSFPVPSEGEIDRPELDI